MPRGGGDRVLINTASLFPPIISSFYNSLLYYCRDFYMITRACTDQGWVVKGGRAPLIKTKGFLHDHSIMHRLGSDLGCKCAHDDAI